MKNSTHRSLWHDTNPLDALPTGPLPKSADVVVVGAGIAGMTSAALLARANRRVVLLDMHDCIGAGDTGQTTAHLSTMVDSGWSTVIRNFGEGQAKLAAEGLHAAMRTIRTFAEQGNIDCDYEEMVAYQYTTNGAEKSELEDELKAMQQVGLPGVSLSEAPLPFKVAAAVQVGGQGQFDPLKYLLGLHKEIVRHGGRLYGGVRVKAVEEHGAEQTVHTDKGDISAKEVVFATHTPPTMMALQMKLVPQRTYAIAFKGDGGVPRGLFYDNEEPYHYIRRHPHAGGDVLIVGGNDHRSGGKTDTDESYVSLEAYAREHFKVGEVVASWSGQVFEPSDGLPLMGRMPGTEHTYVIAGLAGDGMTLGTLGALICAELTQGKRSQWESIFAPGRIKPLAQAVEFAKHNVAVTKHLIKDRVQAWLSKQELGPHQGAVMREEGHVAAAYNDGEKLHLLSPVCPHAGCYVQFNRAERTWDCPCHGSRFACDGKLLSGPAVSDLPPL